MTERARPGKPALGKATYGIAEWYGRLFISLSADERRQFLEPSSTPECPFLASVPDLAPKGKTGCSKKGGVCSIRNFIQTDDGGTQFGPITATCPNRFLENGSVVQHIGNLLLGSVRPLVAKEIPFLRRNATESEGTDHDPPIASRDDVGKIDLVFLHPDKEPKEWCAVEMQAVYFSGAAMSKDENNIRMGTGNAVPVPGGQRRPDFRSSGPKRLMPQLQIKVPSLRRWGKKMVVIIDRPFLDAMAKMPSVEHISNSDIVWLVVDYDEAFSPGTATLVIDRAIFTTLEDSVVGLTAGLPTTLPEFESRLVKKAKLLRQVTDIV